MEITGDKFRVTKVDATQERIVPDKVRQILTGVGLEYVTDEVTYSQLNVKRIAGKPRYPKPVDLEGKTKEEIADLLGEIRENMNNLKKIEEEYKAFLMKELAG